MPVGPVDGLLDCDGRLELPRPTGPEFCMPCYPMAKILITSGPTRQYIDPVRYLSNASSGQMGRCLAVAALHREHEVVVVSGPVQLSYPDGCRVVEVVSTDEMLHACVEEFPGCDGMIGAAAPCDYQPIEVAEQKLRKTGGMRQLKLMETPDIMATLGREKRPGQWTVAFALETDDAHFRAITKLERKFCNLVVLNGVRAIDAADNQVDIIAPDGNVVCSAAGPKQQVADQILLTIQQRLIADSADVIDHE